MQKDYPIVYNASSEPSYILDKAYDVLIRDQYITRTKGYETLEFKIPFNYAGRQAIGNELIVMCAGRNYRIKKINDSRANENITIVECDALWYDLADGELFTHFATDYWTLQDALEEILQGTGWTVGVAESTVTHGYTISEESNRLWALRYIHKVWGGRLVFDTVNMTVSVYESEGERTNNYFTYRKNLSDVSRTIDTTDLITRVYMIGAEEATIGPINDGLDYVENYEWYDQQGLERKLKIHTIEDDRFTNLYYMRDYMIQWLQQYSKPLTSYELTMAYLNELPSLNDYVYVEDLELGGVAGWYEVLEREINVLQREQSRLILESLIKDLTDDLITEENLSSAGVVNTITSVVGTLSPYNLLLNSQADDGLNYWASSGINVLDGAGNSGHNTFVNITGTTTEKTLTQRVYPKTKTNYTFSGYVEAPDGYEYNENDIVGARIIINYEDGSTQEDFISWFGTFEEDEDG